MDRQNNYINNAAINPMGIGRNNSGYGFYDYNRSTAPVYSITRVSGRNSIEMLPMGPNSQALFLDESGTIIWFVETDGAGYKKTIAPYDFSPHQDIPPVDLNDLLNRVKNLEDIINARSTKGGSSKSRNTHNTTESDAV